MTKPTKAKTSAQPYVCQSKEQTQTAITELGNAQRELARLQAALNDEIAAITERYKGDIEAQQSRADLLLNGIHTWCEAHRAELCGDKGKTANLITGEVAWRQRPPKVNVRAADKVIATLKKLGLGKFVRVTEAINKEAILAEPKAVEGIAGLSVESGQEDFLVTPLEVGVVT